MILMVLVLTACHRPGTGETGYYVYLSDTMERPSTSGSLLYATKDRIEKIKGTNGLELGQLILDGTSLLFSDKEADYTYQVTSKVWTKRRRKTLETTGEYTSLLEGRPLKVFNSGYDESGNYVSRIYYDEQLVEAHEFMVSMGQVGSTLYTIGDKDTEHLTLTAYDGAKGILEKSYETLLTLPNTDFIVSQLFGDSHYLYCLYDREGQLALLRIDLKDDHTDVIPLEETIDEDAVPFGHSNFFHQINDDFYLLDRTGKVVVFDKNGKIVKSKDVNLTLNKNFVVDWSRSNQQVIDIASYDDKNNITISLVSLKDFKVTREAIIKGAPYGQQHLYDFKVVTP